MILLCDAASKLVITISGRLNRHVFLRQPESGNAFVPGVTKTSDPGRTHCWGDAHAETRLDSSVDVGYL